MFLCVLPKRFRWVCFPARAYIFSEHLGSNGRADQEQSRVQHNDQFPTTGRVSNHHKFIKFNCQRETTHSIMQRQNNNMTSPPSVRFNCKVAVRAIDAIEREVAWHSAEELQEIKMDAARVVIALRMNTFQETSDTCAHGLTEKVDRELVRRRKADALFSVLDEQNAQKEVMEKFDHELLADVYFEATRLNQKLAELRGKQTAEEVQLLWLPSKRQRTNSCNSSSSLGSFHSTGLASEPMPLIKSASCA